VGEFRSPTADFAFYHSLNIRKKQFFDAANRAERRQIGADLIFKPRLFRKKSRAQCIAHKTPLLTAPKRLFRCGVQGRNRIGAQPNWPKTIRFGIPCKGTP
jgi:hypothetical protein